MAVLGLHCCAWALSSWGRCWLLSTCRAQASHCMVFSLQSKRSRCVGFRNCGSWAQVAVMYRLSRPVACGIFLDQGWNQCSLHCKADSQPLDHHGSPAPVTILGELEKKTTWRRASLVAQWWRTFLPVQETRVRFLIWEDRTCHGVTKPVCPNYSACVLEPRSCK